MEAKFGKDATDPARVNQLENDFYSLKSGTLIYELTGNGKHLVAIVDNFLNKVTANIGELVKNFALLKEDLEKCENFRDQY